MEVLTNKRVYLSSPIEFCKDDSWRHDVKKVLTETFKLKVFDPHSDSKQHLAVDAKSYRENRDYDKLHTIAKHFVKKDLAIVDRADIVIGHLPSMTCTTGCVHEIINSSNAKKLTLLVEGTDKSKLPIWYHGFIKHQFMFGKWEELYQFLEDVNKNKYIENDKLFFLYNYPDVWLS